MIAICIGHSRHGDNGAKSVGNVSEHTFNTVLGRHTREKLLSLGIPSIVVDYYDGGSYSAAMTWLAARLRALQAKAAIELHFNSGPSNAQGHEYLYWHSSLRGQALARSLASVHQSRFMHSAIRRNKGTLAIKTTAERGGQFLKKTHCPAVIAEPFFGSNKAEWLHATSHVHEYADTLAQAIADWLAVQP